LAKLAPMFHRIRTLKENVMTRFSNILA